MYSEFDKRDVYDQKIQPIVNDLSMICKKEKMPFFLSVMVKNHNAGDEAETEYRREAIAKETLGIRLPQDEIGSHLAVSRGFPVLFDRQIELDEEIDTDDMWDMTEEDLWDDDDMDDDYEE